MVLVKNNIWNVNLEFVKIERGNVIFINSCVYKMFSFILIVLSEN